MFLYDGGVSRVTWRSGFMALLAALVMLAAACSSEPERAEIIDALERAGLETPIAECVADAFAELPEADRKLIAERGSNGVRDDREVDDEPIDEVRRKMSECRNEIPAEEATPEDDAAADDEAAGDGATSEGAATSDGEAAAEGAAADDEIDPVDEAPAASD